jgi:hypothetical protein
MSSELNEPFNDDVPTAEDVKGQMRSTGVMLLMKNVG